MMDIAITNIAQEGNAYRKNYAEGFSALIKRLENEAFDRREKFMPADTFPTKIEEYRKKYCEMIGLDRLSFEDLPSPTLTKLGCNNDINIYRLITHITPELTQYGLLFVPCNVSRAPLIIAQHGGGGTPELCSDLDGKNNYNRMVRRLLDRNAVVYAPQLLLWDQESDVIQPVPKITFNRKNIDNNLKRFGLSITAVEIAGIRNSITFLSGQEWVDSERIGMIGLSYGGYFTLHTMAADTRIKAGFSSGCFNDRNKYPWFDWTYRDCANTFHDAEIAGLCAPRKLYVAVGKEDQVFDYQTAIPESERVGKYFEAFGCRENFVFTVWDGGHTVPDSDDGYDFLFSALDR